MSRKSFSSSTSSTASRRADDVHDVFSEVQAVVNPGIFKTPAELIDVLADVEERASVETRLSRRRCVIAGSWASVAAARNVLVELSGGAGDRLDTTVSDRDLVPFEILNGDEAREHGDKPRQSHADGMRLEDRKDKRREGGSRDREREPRGDEPAEHRRIGEGWLRADEEDRVQWSRAETTKDSHREVLKGKDGVERPENDDGTGADLEEDETYSSSMSVSAGARQVEQQDEEKDMRDTEDEWIKREQVEASAREAAMGSDESLTAGDENRKIQAPSESGKVSPPAREVYGMAKFITEGSYVRGSEVNDEPTANPEQSEDDEVKQARGMEESASESKEPRRAESIITQNALQSREEETPEEGRGGRTDVGSLSTEELLVDRTLFECLKWTNELSIIEENYGVTLNVLDVDQNTYLIISAPDGKPTSEKNIAAAKKAFIELYHHFLDGCSQEICEVSKQVPVQCAEEVLAETYMNFPGINISRSEKDHRVYSFVGPSKMVKHCCHFFIREVQRRLNGQSVANKLQCTEAQIINQQYVMSTPLGDLSQHGHSPSTMNKNYADLPDLGLLNVGGKGQSAKMTSSGLSAAASHKPTRVVAAFDDDNVGKGSRRDVDNGKTLRQPKITPDEEKRATKTSVVERERIPGSKEDAGDVKLPELRLVSASKKMLCGQCTENANDFVVLGCGHQFCVTCILNASRLPKFCPECGESIRQEAIENLIEKDVERKTMAAVDERSKTLGATRRPAEPSRASETIGSRESMTQGDSTVIQKHVPVLCNQCATMVNFLIPLECGQAFCISCTRNLAVQRTCPDCDKPMKRVQFEQPRCLISHVMSKKMRLPNFPNCSSLVIRVGIPAAKVKGNNGTTLFCEARDIETYLPNNPNGRSMYKLLLKLDEKLFEVGMINAEKGIFVLAEGIDLYQDKAMITEEYLSRMQSALLKLGNDEVD